MSAVKVSRRTFIRRSALFCVVAVGSAPLLASCGSGGGSQSTLENLRQQGRARVGYSNEPPWAFLEGGELKGAEPDIARATLKKLGVSKLEGVQVDYGAMIPGLNAGRFDIVASGLLMTPERCPQVLYSGPTACSTEAFVVQSGNPLGLESYEDVASNTDASLGLPSGGLEYGYANEAGIDDSQLVDFSGIRSGLEALQADRIDALGFPTLSVNQALESGQNADFEVISPIPDAPTQCAGTVFNQEDEEFRNAYNEALDELKESGEFASILEQYGFPVEAAMETTTEEQCSQ